jgi:hypothetical protein
MEHKQQRMAVLNLPAGKKYLIFLETVWGTTRQEYICGTAWCFWHYNYEWNSERIYMYV